MAKFNIYQVLPRLWGKGKFSDWTQAEFDYLTRMGISHVWYTGVLRHARGKAFVKGEPGSPYAITDYYDVNPYLADKAAARMKEFEALIARTHRAGLKVILDFVPNHVAWDYHSFCAPKGVRDLGADDDPTQHWSKENDFYYYPGTPLQLPEEVTQAALQAGLPAYTENPAKASGNCFTPQPGKNDWYETVRLNYCPFHTGTWDKMYEIVRFWAAKGIDGFRCDMVELVPPPFFQWMIAKIKEEFPAVIFIAEVYDREGYRQYLEEIGFDLLYHKTGFYDSLRAITQCGLRRAGIHPGGRIPEGADVSPRLLSEDWQRVDGLQDRLLNFLENHDEQRLASDFYAGNGARGLAALSFALLFNRAPFMLYFGQEIGERGMDSEGFSGRDGRTSIFDFWTIDSIQTLENIIRRGAYKNGSVNELVSEGLSIQQAQLLLRYRQVLSLSLEEPFRSGKTFDLCYCQGGNAEGLFPFLRGDGKVVSLVVCNFTAQKRRERIMLPPEAADYLNRKDLPASFEVTVPAFDFSVASLE